MLDHNNFSGKLQSEWKTPNLQSLIANNNEFHGPIPMVLGGVLKDLWLNHNVSNALYCTMYVLSLFSIASTDPFVCRPLQSFSGTIPDIARLSLLEKAILHNNNLSGPIPSGVFQQLSHLGKAISSGRLKSSANCPLQHYAWWLNHLSHRVPQDSKKPPVWSNRVGRLQLEASSQSELLGSGLPIPCRLRVLRRMLLE
jgi:hypothetical protein